MIECPISQSNRVFTALITIKVCGVQYDSTARSTNTRSGYRFGLELGANIANLAVAFQLYFHSFESLLLTSRGTISTWWGLAIFARRSLKLCSSMISRTPGNIRVESILFSMDYPFRKDTVRLNYVKLLWLCTASRLEGAESRLVRENDAPW